MKDSAGKFTRRLRLAAAAAMAVTAACAKSNKPADVAQDSILVKDADVSANKTDTAGAATAALVRERGSGAQLPTLTSGAPVTRSSDLAPAMPATGTLPPASRTPVQPTMPPPKRLHPSPVLPPRESTSTTPPGSVITSPASPQQVTQPPPVAQPISPAPRPVTQPATPPVTQPATPPPPPKKDSTDSLTAGTGAP